MWLGNIGEGQAKTKSVFFFLYQTECKTGALQRDRGCRRCVKGRLLHEAMRVGQMSKLMGT